MSHNRKLSYISTVKCYVTIKNYIIKMYLRSCKMSSDKLNNNLYTNSFTIQSQLSKIVIA